MDSFIFTTFGLFLLENCNFIRVGNVSYISTGSICDDTSVDIIHFNITNTRVEDSGRLMYYIGCGYYAYAQIILPDSGPFLIDNCEFRNISDRTITIVLVETYNLGFNVTVSNSIFSDSAKTLQTYFIPYFGEAAVFNVDVINCTFNNIRGVGSLDIIRAISAEPTDDLVIRFFNSTV